MCVYVRSSCGNLPTDIFGNLTYSLIGDNSKNFNIDAVTGVITVANSTFLDRERLPEASFSAVATDKAPISTRRSSIVPVNIQLYFHFRFNRYSRNIVILKLYHFYFDSFVELILILYGCIGLCDDSGCKR